MPVQRCSKNGSPGFRWGTEGKCYTYTSNSEASKERAKSKAAKQGRAVKASQNKRKGK